MGKIISIIGSNSFLASYLIEEFGDDETIELNLFARRKTEHAVCKARVNQLPFNYPVDDLNLASLLASDVIIYCAAAGVQAASSLTDIDEVYAINAFLPIRIITYLSANSFSGKWISFGTYFEIGDNAALQSYSEEEIVASNLSVPNHYCCSKRLLTKFIDCRQFTIQAWHLVLPTIYGAKENKQRLIPYVIEMLKKQELPLLSAGTQIRQYVHCLDVVKLLRIIIDENPPYGIYNVTAAETLAIKDLVKAMFSLFGQDPKGSLGARNSRDESMQVLQLESTKIGRAIPSWSPRIRLQEGLQEYL
ncbi:NAD(P)-dependent oxidoreductase [Hymenobacter sp. BT186]|uniref:NAD(P)-dependent oxidoreductase n=1 Tax=Hymenobacter telluris TaxID=2816474 RepID=A0A939ETZ0_9BACT|nr:NAD-dependent epimerase/dehydratase family protein [Hymenobacter telluris]MBO0357378.1 NAD(P)-dependent oxidoreductase [Hymenobacter telluris]MBW3373404.1 NAD-dependent epimerase/dehydratase family protein [Hymenobacter norwichensis]